MPDKVYSNAAWYPIEIAGLKRELPVCKLSDEVSIAGFVIFGDVEMTVRCAEELLKRVPEHDILVTAESKGIPLIHEMARQEGAQTYVVARKGPKLYMKDPFFVEVQSISTAKAQKLYLDETEAAKLKGRRVLIVDDVISTGESLHAVEQLVQRAGGNIVGRACILAEGDAIGRKDIIYPVSYTHLDVYKRQGQS